jgi:hypothetical protein
VIRGDKAGHSTWHLKKRTVPFQAGVRKKTMPALSVSIDGKLVAEVPTSGLDVLAIRVGGTTTEDDLAVLDVSGGAYPDSEQSTYLIWIDSMPIQPSQIICVTFKSEGALSHPGKTINELYPDEPSDSPYIPITIEERVTELRSTPLVRESFSFWTRLSSGKELSMATEPTEHSFSFSLLWSSHDPTYATCTLSSSSLESLITKAPRTKYLRERLAGDESVEFRVA